MKKLLLFFSTMSLWAGLQAQSTTNSVTVEAESGVLGLHLILGISGTMTYVAPDSNLIASSNPGTASRVATYTVTFPTAGIISCMPV